MQTITMKISRVEGTGQDIPLPQYATAGASGMDLHAATTEDILLQAGERALIPCGFRMEIPAGYEAQVRSRSGLAIKNGVAVLNAPGTIDSDYRGEVKVILINHGKDVFSVKRGERIAQMVISQVTKANLAEVVSLEETARGEGGFGHTGQ